MRRLSSNHIDVSLQSGCTALVNAVWNRHLATVAELVRLGADINAKDKVCLR
jgi:hypothetical protein